MQFKTAEEYVRYRAKWQKEYRKTYPKNPIAPISLLDQLRSLPLEEAEKLLDVFSYVSDGDYGYGSWEAGLEYLLDPSRGD
jgi:hypothetical protein